MNFFDLHRQDEPLLLGNVWNVASAKTFEKSGYKAIGTSSASVAISMGYTDGENIPFDELLYFVAKIKEHVSIPLNVDIEGGYGNTTQEIISNIDQLCKLGVEGINIEDSKIEGGTRNLLNAKIFGNRIASIKSHLEQNGHNLFLNVRTDAFITKLPNALEETIERAKIYEEQGADGIFVPLLTDISEIQKVTEATELPLNVMFFPSLPNFDELKQASVKRISMGNAIFASTQNHLSKEITQILSSKSAASVF